MNLMSSRFNLTFPQILGLFNLSQSLGRCSMTMLSQLPSGDVIVEEGGGKKYVLKKHGGSHDAPTSDDDPGDQTPHTA